MFNKICGHDVPFLYSNMSIFLLYSGVSGISDYNIRIFSFDNNSVNYDIVGKFNSDKVTPMFSIFNLSNIAFNEFGLHQVEFWVGGKVLATTRLDIIKVEEEDDDGQ
jgi:hypothetical protein